MPGFVTELSLSVLFVVSELLTFVVPELFVPPGVVSAGVVPELFTTVIYFATSPSYNVLNVTITSYVPASLISVTAAPVVLFLNVTV